MNWSMLWIRSTYKLPAENREILIKCKSIVGLGRFIRKEKKFILNDGTHFDCTIDPIEWMDLATKEPESKKTIYYS